MNNITRDLHYGHTYAEPKKGKPLIILYPDECWSACLTPQNPTTSRTVSGWDSKP